MQSYGDLRISKSHMNWNGLVLKLMFGVRPKYFPKNLILKNSQALFLSQSESPSFTAIQNNRYPPYLEAVSSIRNLRTRHAVVIGTHNRYVIDPTIRTETHPAEVRFETCKICDFDCIGSLLIEGMGVKYIKKLSLTLKIIHLRHRTGRYLKVRSHVATFAAMQYKKLRNSRTATCEQRCNPKSSGCRTCCPLLFHAAHSLKVATCEQGSQGCSRSIFDIGFVETFAAVATSVAAQMCQ
ncbi:hypothetical protein ANN_05527 [Periplaneta americana]|uniref:Uncharacterized protein n=1 Tax=Periplaneta americana TaxID=6978 RepID=A0ABQ8TCW0_PERAM|nr:hypothetical protein ANN_05527 [Periplaneta americana]